MGGLTSGGLKSPSPSPYAGPDVAQIICRGLCVGKFHVAKLCVFVLP